MHASDACLWLQITGNRYAAPQGCQTNQSFSFPPNSPVMAILKHCVRGDVSLVGALSLLRHVEGGAITGSERLSRPSLVTMTYTNPQHLRHPKSLG